MREICALNRQKARERGSISSLASLVLKYRVLAKDKIKIDRVQLREQRLYFWQMEDLYGAATEC